MANNGKANKKNALSSNKIVKTLEKNSAQLKSFGVKKIGLFGSYLTKASNNSSDIDFIVKLKKPTFDSYMDLKFFLEKTFRKKADVIVEGSLKPALHYVRKEAKYAKGF